MSTGVMWFWLIPTPIQADLRLLYLCLPPVPPPGLQWGSVLPVGWLKSPILYLHAGYGDSSSFSSCVNLQ